MIGKAAAFTVVIAGLDPAIHSVTSVVSHDAAEWVHGPSPDMTTVL